MQNSIKFISSSYFFSKIHCILPFTCLFIFKNSYRLIYSSLLSNLHATKSASDLSILLRMLHVIRVRFFIKTLHLLMLILLHFTACVFLMDFNSYVAFLLNASALTPKLFLILLYFAHVLTSLLS